MTIVKMVRRKRNIRKRKIGRNRIASVDDGIGIMIVEEGGMTIHLMKIGGSERSGKNIEIEIGREEAAVLAVRDQILLLVRVQLQMTVMIIGGGSENGKQVIEMISLRGKRKDHLPDRNRNKSSLEHELVLLSSFR
jgi:hypothetical protein